MNDESLIEFVYDLKWMIKSKNIYKDLEDFKDLQKKIEGNFEKIKSLQLKIKSDFLN